VIRYDEALDLCLRELPRLPATSVPAAAAVGCALAGDLRARADQPRHDQSAMDGYAVLLDDVRGASPRRPVRLRLAGTSPAGGRRLPVLRPGTCVRVLTGGRVPRATEAVVIQEHCRREGDMVLVERAPRPGANIRRRGEESRRGDLLLPAGTPVTPPVAALALTHGHAALRVRARPRVVVLTTGDELVPAGVPLRPGQIHDSNGPAVAAALVRAGAAVVAVRHVPDDRGRVVRALRAALRRADAVVTIGGASVGDRDYLGEAHARLGVRLLFRKVAVKPGKPNIVGIAPDGTAVFSLPGNPVSALVSLVTLVIPALHGMMGYADPRPRTQPAVLDRPLPHRPGRREWVRAALARSDDTLTARPLRHQGSHMMLGLAAADALVLVPEESGDLPAGSRVEVIPLAW